MRYLKYLAALLLAALPLAGTAASYPLAVPTSSTQPLDPVYHLNPDGSVVLQVCHDWSCAKRRTLQYSRADMAQVRQQMAMCPGDDLHQRLQRLRIGVWQMELLAEKYLPALANDQALNDLDRELDGRTDCVDNATNIATYLQVLIDLDQLPGWSLAPPQVRNRFDIRTVHWTAVVTDRTANSAWSVDGWFRPNGHLPFVMPVANWAQEQAGWSPPFDRLNPYPEFSQELCREPAAARNERPDKTDGAS